MLRNISYPNLTSFSDRIEELGITPLENVLEEMGGWPVVVGDEWDEEAFSWTNAIYTNRKIGYSIDYLIDFSVTIDVKNSSWRIIDVCFVHLKNK